MDNNEVLSHYQMVEAKRKQKEIKDNKQKERCKKRLSNIISTKMRTSFIGSISIYEENFGFLWGHGKPDSDLDENEIAMKQVWETARSRILDNGNSQLRASVNEVNNYTIDWNMHRMEMPLQQNFYDKEN